MSISVPLGLVQPRYFRRDWGLGHGLTTFTAWRRPARSGRPGLASLEAHARSRTTFSVREAMHRTVLDLSGVSWGSVSDLALQTPGSLAVDLILRDSDDCRVPAPGVLALARDALVADLRGRVRIRGLRTSRELWLAKDVIGHTAILLPSASRCRVVDVSVAMVDGRTAITGVTVTVGHRWHRSTQEVAWSKLAQLELIESGQGLPHHAALAKTLGEPVRRMILMHLSEAAADALDRAIRSPLPTRPDGDE